MTRRSSSARPSRRASAGSSRRTSWRAGLAPGNETMYVGERCSIVTCAASLRQRRDERHRGRAAADHDDALAGVVDVLGPVLGVHDPSAEALDAREVWACNPRRSGSSRCTSAGSRSSDCTVSTRVAALGLDRPARFRASTTRRAPRDGRKRILSLDADLAAPSRGRSRGSPARPRSPLRPPRDGTSSRACTCRSPSGCRGSGRGPRYRRCRRAPRGSRSSCRGSWPAGDSRRRCRTSRHRRSARQRVRRTSRTIRFGDCATELRGPLPPLHSPPPRQGRDRRK